MKLCSICSGELGQYLPDMRKRIERRCPACVQKVQIGDDNTPDIALCTVFVIAADVVDDQRFARTIHAKVEHDMPRAKEQRPRRHLPQARPALLRAPRQSDLPSVRCAATAKRTCTTAGTAS